MIMFENDAVTSWANHKAFSDKSIKIHRAEGDYETK